MRNMFLLILLGSISTTSILICTTNIIMATKSTAVTRRQSKCKIQPGKKIINVARVWPEPRPVCSPSRSATCPRSVWNEWPFGCHWFEREVWSVDLRTFRCWAHWGRGWAGWSWRSDTCSWLESTYIRMYRIILNHLWHKQNNV